MSKVLPRRTCVKPAISPFRGLMAARDHMPLSTTTPTSTVIGARSERKGIASAELFAFLLFLLSQPLLSQQSTELFRKNCAGCHGEDARGSAKAPGLAMNQRVAGQSPEQLSAFLAQGNIAGGMPSFSDLSATDRSALAKYPTSSSMRGSSSGRQSPPKPRARSPGGLRNPATGSLITEMTQAIGTVHSKRSTPRMSPR